MATDCAGVGEETAALRVDDELTSEEKAERAAREAAEIAAIARDWNRFDKEELVREFGDVAAKPYRLVVSNYSNDDAKLKYLVCVEPRNYAAIARKSNFKVQEAPAMQIGFPGVVLRHMTLDRKKHGVAYAYDMTEGELAGNRADSG